MNEVRALVQAFDDAVAAGERTALATIVSVEGSSYRRPGARMLISECGSTTGTISAGCLENDVIEHAKRVIATGTANLVEYDDSSTTDEMAWGLGLGCNGVVRVLVEPVTAGSKYIETLRQSAWPEADASPVSVATVYQCSHAGPPHPDIEVGARLFFSEREDFISQGLNGSASSLLNLVRSKIEGSAAFQNHTLKFGEAVVKVFVEKLLPPVPLVIFGAGHDAVPIVELARKMGWQIEVIDPQSRAVSRERFAGADRVTLVPAEELGQRIAISSRTLALVMSHNYVHDIASLKFLLASPARYIGVMGPRKRTERMLAELGAADASFRLDRIDSARLHSPVGLDIGANGPDEIALSIVAEMRAVMEGRQGGLLRDFKGPIHNVPQQYRTPTEPSNKRVI